MKALVIIQKCMCMSPPQWHKKVYFQGGGGVGSFMTSYNNVVIGLI